LDGEEGGAVPLAVDALQALQRLADLDPAQAPLRDQLQRALVELKDVASGARDLADEESADPAELERRQRRLHDWESSARKLRCAEDELPAAWERLKAERDALLALSQDEAGLRKALEAAKSAYSQAALRLSQAREKAAAEMIKAMTRELQALLGPKALFTVRLTRRHDEGAFFEVEGRACRGDRQGVDEVEFLIAPNVGEAPKALAKIASGGELSRVTLALKTVFSRQEGAPCLVFDEIDAGISGRVADLVGGRISALAKRHQVLCITHLPQIASLPARHLRVSKSVQKDQTITDVQVLDAQGRQAELAGMISGGAGATESALAHAKALLLQAEGAAD
jgi:DNA repair protein RecN (Recombination protein N)